MFLFFTADNRCRYCATLKPQLKDYTSVRWRSIQHGILWKPGALRSSKTTYLFTGNHLSTAQNLGTNVTDQFIETIASWSEYCALLDGDAVGRLRVIKNSTENLR